ncbi:hypothetical protein K438DRAFT_1544414, partial [Mycena galopus ATCC 62051]
FRTLQPTYTPVAIVVLGQQTKVPVDKQLEHIPLFLPSTLMPAQHMEEIIEALALIEDSLHDVQCLVALEKLQLQLHIKSRLFMYKMIQSCHQGPNTQARVIVERNEYKIRLHSEKYQMAWEARRLLADGDVSHMGWEMLRKEDMWCMEDVEELA